MDAIRKKMQSLRGETESLYAIIANGGWYISEDGGDSWSALTNLPSENYALSVAVSPDFGTDGIVAVAGYDGAYLSHDRGKTWAWLNTLELHEETSPQVVLEGEWYQQILAGASGNMFVQTDADGDVLNFTFEGVAIELLAPLCELLHDPSAARLACEAWVALFPQLWRTLTASEQLAQLGIPILLLGDLPFRRLNAVRT